MGRAGLGFGSPHIVDHGIPYCGCFYFFTTLSSPIAACSRLMDKLPEPWQANRYEERSYVHLADHSYHPIKGGLAHALRFSTSGFLSLAIASADGSEVPAFRLLGKIGRDPP